MLTCLSVSEPEEHIEDVCGGNNSLPHSVQQAVQVEYRKAPKAKYEQ